MNNARIDKALFDEAKLEVYERCLACKSLGKALSQYRNYLSLTTCGLKSGYYNPPLEEDKRIEELQKHIRDLVINKYKFKYLEEG